MNIRMGGEILGAYKADGTDERFMSVTIRQSTWQATDIEVFLT